MTYDLTIPYICIRYIIHVEISLSYYHSLVPVFPNKLKATTLFGHMAGLRTASAPTERVSILD